MRLFHSLVRALLIGLLSGALFGFAPTLPARAQAQIVDVSTDYAFGGQINFHAHLQADIPVTAAWLVLHLQNKPGSLTRQVTPEADGTIDYQIDPTSISLRAFSDVEYWYRLDFSDGTSRDSQHATFTYEDNRFDWSKIEAAPFVLHWYDGDPEAAQTILEVSQEALQSNRKLLPLQAPDQIRLYIYPSPAEMQTTLLLSGQAWMVGHADPDLGVMVASLPPGPEQRLEARRLIPHELMHIMLYQTLGAGYSNLPTWLNEGLASLAELVPNPEYPKILEQQKEGLIPISSLCASFPADNRSALLSYAEASSFTRYLDQKYGATGLQALIQSYAGGEGCESAPQEALGISLSDLDAQWRQATFFSQPQPQPVAPSGPWILLLAVVVALPMLVGTIGIFGKQLFNRI